MTLPFSFSSTVIPNPAVGLVIDGRTLNTIFQGQLEHKFLELTKYSRSVLCCRCTPLQKSMVVKLVRSQLKVMTLAIGEHLTLSIQILGLCFCCSRLAWTVKAKALFYTNQVKQSGPNLPSLINSPILSRSYVPCSTMERAFMVKKHKTLCSTTANKLVVGAGRGSSTSICQDTVSAFYTCPLSLCELRPAT